MGSMVAAPVFSVVGKELRESQGIVVDGTLVNYEVDGRKLFFLSRQEAIKDAIRHENAMEAHCDVVISRIEAELREARRESAELEVIAIHEFNISTVSTRRDGHRDYKAALSKML